MATTFKLYKDSGLTQPFVPGTDFIGPVTDPPEDFVLYLGSTEETRQVEAQSDPGVDQIVASVVDAASGSGLEATDVKLATTNGGLTAATGGASLSLGTSVLGGVANLVEIHIRVAFAAGGLASDQNVSIQLNTLTESTI
jgi:hypothetical protein